VLIQELGRSRSSTLEGNTRGGENRQIENLCSHPLGTRTTEHGRKVLRFIAVKFLKSERVHKKTENTGGIVSSLLRSEITVDQESTLVKKRKKAEEEN